jgi:hypothetical protein
MKSKPLMAQLEMHLYGHQPCVCERQRARVFCFPHTAATVRVYLGVNMLLFELKVDPILYLTLVRLRHSAHYTHKLSVPTFAVTCLPLSTPTLLSPSC